MERLCGVRPDTTTIVGRRLEAGGAFAAEPLCRLGSGHDGAHVYQSAISDHPFYETANAAERLIDEHTVVFQKWTCQHCGARETMADPDLFHTTGRCEECGLVTDIVANGCNYMVIKSTVTAAELADVLKGLDDSGRVQ